MKKYFQIKSLKVMTQNIIYINSDGCEIFGDTNFIKYIGGLQNVHKSAENS